MEQGNYFLALIWRPQFLPLLFSDLNQTGSIIGFLIFFAKSIPGALPHWDQDSIAPGVQSFPCTVFSLKITSLKYLVSLEKTCMPLVLDMQKNYAFEHGVSFSYMADRRGIHWGCWPGLEGRLWVEPGNCTMTGWVGLVESPTSWMYQLPCLGLETSGISYQPG